MSRTTNRHCQKYVQHDNPHERELPECRSNHGPADARLDEARRRMDRVVPWQASLQSVDNRITNVSSARLYRMSRQAACRKSRYALGIFGNHLQVDALSMVREFLCCAG